MWHSGAEREMKRRPVWSENERREGEWDNKRIRESENERRGGESENQRMGE